jgi:hypothetical protein
MEKVKLLFSIIFLFCLLIALPAYTLYQVTYLGIETMPFIAFVSSCVIVFDFVIITVFSIITVVDYFHEK